MILFVFITYAKNYGGATKVTYPSGYAVTNVYGNLTAVKNGETKDGTFPHGNFI